MSSSSRRGSVTMIAIAMSMLVVAMAWAAVSVQSSLAAEAAVRANDRAARAIAEAGLELAIARLDADASWRGVRGYDFGEGKIDVEAAAVAGAPNRWRIRSVGRLSSTDRSTVAACCVALVERRSESDWGRLCWRWEPDVR